MLVTVGRVTCVRIDDLVITYQAMSLGWDLGKGKEESLLLGVGLLVYELMI